MDLAGVGAPALPRRGEPLSMTSLNLMGPHHWEQGSCNQYLLLFDRSSASPRVHYLLIDTSGRRPRILPKVSTTSMTKVKDIVGYRVVVLNNYMYVVGGKHEPAGAYLSQCYRFDSRNNQWLRRACLHRARTRFTATAVDGFIYVCGGETRGGSITDSVEMYDPTADSWTEVRRLPQPRADHAACVADNRLFVSGGVGTRGGGTTSFWQYDTENDFWAQALGNSAMPTPRYKHSMVSYRGKIYCLAGITTVRQNHRSKDVEDGSITCFDCNVNHIEARITGTWDRSLPPLRQPRCMAATFKIGNQVFVVGGHSYTEGRDQHVIEYFHTRRKRWAEGFSLATENVSLKCLDCCILKVPTRNKEFSTLGYAMNNKWILW